MGTVDIETALDEFITSGNIYWDDNKFTFDEYSDKIKQAIEKVTNLHYAASDIMQQAMMKKLKIGMCGSQMLLTKQINCWETTIKDCQQHRLTSLS